MRERRGFDARDGGSLATARGSDPPEIETIRSTGFGDWLRIDTQDVRLSATKHMVAHVVHFPRIALVVALDRDDLVLIRQFRFPARSWLIEVPAGRVEEHEDPASAARRELREETGYLAGRLEPVGQIRISPHLSDEVTHMYLATDLRLGAPAREEGELIQRVVVGQNRVRSMVDAGKIVDAKTIAALSIIGII
ncbi:NUDIX hydrolase [Actinomadura luteofluorescens]|uniref:NUDIX domain-containing protein n=1 Tax=Actinomadura luteofluorescens TaxID=46163 RepID=UPI0021649F29|nr:NUDIX hydrolase [Actinomadura glauciflava]MCR3742642.1 ADP-ribose pyrophosphatase [Actinomadura glauciflava]